MVKATIITIIILKTTYIEIFILINISLDINPDVITKPIIFKIEIIKRLKIEKFKLMELLMYWEELIVIMINPLIMNKDLLKNAWENKWKKTKPWTEEKKEMKIRPNWFNVEKAINFLRSDSIIADIEPINIVVIKINNIILFRTVLKIKNR